MLLLISAAANYCVIAATTLLLLHHHDNLSVSTQHILPSNHEPHSSSITLYNNVIMIHVKKSDKLLVISPSRRLQHLCPGREEHGQKLDYIYNAGL